MAEEQGEVLKQQIKLNAKIEKAETGSSYQVVISNSSNYSNTLLTTTQTQCDFSGNVVFQEFAITDYYFEIEQPFFIKVTKNGSIFHQISTTLGTIFGSRNNTFIQKADRGNEVISIVSAPLSDTVEYLDINLTCANVTPKELKHYENCCYFLISSSSKVYQSESISAQGTFAATRIPSNLLTPQFTITFFNYKHKEIYSATTTLQDFTNPNGPYKILNFDLKKKHRIIKINNNSKIFKDFSFLDYIKAGCRLGLDIAIDFTNSNGHPLDPISLHRVAPGIQNDYEKAIRACGSIVAQYDYDQLFPVFGFGAKIREETEASMCFNITLTDNSYINGIEGVVQEYHNVLQNLTFFGPTYFSPIIRQVISDIRHEANSFNYHILMILTDGVINDMNMTIDCLCEGAMLPLSVIIIGIGNADFSNMVVLDADDNPLVDSRGRTCVRDLVQFVPFNEFKNDPKELARQVLEEIPRQIVEFYAQNNIYPDNIN